MSAHASILASAGIFEMGSSQKTVRNDEIRQRCASGESMNQLAREFGLSLQRVSQIIHQKSQ